MSLYRQVPEKPHKSVKDIGFSEDRNARYRRTMEDGHCMIDGYCDHSSDALFAVYDGHGGRSVVQLVEKTFHENLEKLLRSEPEYSENRSIKVSRAEELVREAYKITDQGTSGVSFGGSTAVSCLIVNASSNDGDDATRRTLFSANCGDARAVVSENWIAHRLTHDHKATDDEEVKRIEGKGGSVVNGRVNGFLAVARSFGNNTLKDWVISEPYQSHVALTENHNILILACDGLWDVMEDQDAVDFCKQIIEQQQASPSTEEGEQEHTNSNVQEEDTDDDKVIVASIAQQCAQQLLDKAKELGSTDNLSVMVVIL